MPENKDNLVQKLLLVPNSISAINRLVTDNILSQEEAVMINMRVATCKLNIKVTELLKKTKELYDAF